MKIVEVVAALIRDGARILICQRPMNRSRGGLWEFAGGKVELGESGEEAVMRECREELAIELSVGEIYMQVTHSYPDMTVHLTLYEATIRSGVPQRLEHQALAWILPREIPQYDFCPADREILERIMGD